MSHEYDDIIHLNRPISKKHRPMSMLNRAAQFSPFAALVGYDDLVKETGRLTDEKIELNEDKINEINSKLVYLNDNKDVVGSFTYFIKDNKKKGGRYEVISSSIKKIDMDNNRIVFTNGEIIKIEDIVDINF